MAPADLAPDVEGVVMPPEEGATAGAGETVTVRELLARLRERGLFEEGDEALERVGEHLEAEESKGQAPYYPKMLVGCGGCAAAPFFGCAGAPIFVTVPLLILVVILLVAVGDSEPRFPYAWLLLIVPGLHLIAVATVLRRLSKHPLPAQLALALSIAGQALTVFGVWVHAGWPGNFGVVPTTAAVLWVVLYPLFRDPVHRFLSTLLVTATLTVWLLFRKDMHHELRVLMLVEAVGVGVLFTHARTPSWARPFAYALAVSLCPTAALAPVFRLIAPEAGLPAPWWPSNVVLALWLVWLYQRIAGGPGRLLREPLVLAVAATAALATSTPGILVALGLMVLGYSSDDRILLVLGIVCLPVFVALYYCGLDLEPVARSGVLVGSGAVLIVARACLGTRRWAKATIEGIEGGEEAG